MPQHDLIIFDCDGVLVDSEILAAEEEAKLLTKAGFPITAEELAERYAGLTFRDILLAVEKETETPLQASLIGEAEARVDKVLAARVRPLTGAAEAAAHVPAKRCVCSNSSPARLKAMLDKTGLAPLFGEAVFSVEDTSDKKPKPAPDVFLHAAGAMDADPARTIVIEDSVHGIAGAKAAGMRVVGFTGAAHSYPGHADALTEAGAETVIHRLSDLQAVLRAMSEWTDDIA